jgi:hypothetical protein
MLILDDSDRPDLSAASGILGEIVPPGHVCAAARSPGSEDLEEDFLAMKLLDGQGLPVLQ